jgi:hypothetical protein
MVDLGSTEISEWAGQDRTASLRRRSHVATSGRAQLAYEITGVHDGSTALPIFRISSAIQRRWT